MNLSVAISVALLTLGPALESRAAEPSGNFVDRHAVDAALARIRSTASHPFAVLARGEQRLTILGELHVKQAAHATAARELLGLFRGPRALRAIEAVHVERYGNRERLNTGVEAGYRAQAEQLKQQGHAVAGSSVVSAFALTVGECFRPFLGGEAGRVHDPGAITKAAAGLAHTLAEASHLSEQSFWHRRG